MCRPEERENRTVELIIVGGDSQSAQTVVVKGVER